MLDAYIIDAIKREEAARRAAAEQRVQLELPLVERPVATEADVPSAEQPYKQEIPIRPDDT